MYLLLLVENALADPLPVVAMGDGVVAGAPHRSPGAEGSSASGSAATGSAAAEGDPAVPGGWVTVLADCLEERAPQRFAVVDRGAPGDTVSAAKARIAGIRELGPAWVVVTLGSQELADEKVDPKRLGRELDALVDELRQKGAGSPPNVLLVGVVPPTLSQEEPHDIDLAATAPAAEGAAAPPVVVDPAKKQSAADARAVGWNKVLASIAAPGQGVVHLDLWSDWPKDGEQRSSLTANGWSLSDQGHAKVAASVCDAVLAARP